MLFPMSFIPSTKPQMEYIPQKPFFFFGYDLVF